MDKKVKIIVLLVMYAPIMSRAAVEVPWLLTLICLLMKMFLSWTTPSGEDPTLNDLSRFFFWVIWLSNELYEEWQKERQAQIEKENKAEARKKNLVDQFVARRQSHDRMSDQIDRMKREGQFESTAVYSRFQRIIPKFIQPTIM